MKEFTFYTRDDVESFVELLREIGGYESEIRAILADPSGGRYIWYVKVCKKAIPFTPAGESVL